MVRLPPKKGPKMTRVYNPKGMSNDQLTQAEIEAQLEASGRRAFEVIEEARAKMSPSEREKIDEEADAILENALRNVERPRRRA